MSEPFFDDSVQQALRGIVNRVAQPAALQDQLNDVLKYQGELVRIMTDLRDIYRGIDSRLCDLEAQQADLMQLLSSRRQRKKAILP